MQFRNLPKSLIFRIAHFLMGLVKEKQVVNHIPAMTEWFADSGDRTLRLDYDLDENSVVFDLGGYEGQWASDIYSKYRSRIFVFEPSEIFCDSIKKRFERNPDVEVFNFGLSNKNEEVKLYMQADGSSVLHAMKSNNNQYELIKLRDISEFLSESKIVSIDLMKINIEGAEYEVLERLIKTDWIKCITNIQVQFHNFVNDAEERMLLVQKALSLTHKPTYQYKFVWENWTRK